ncbi:hypothetical protein K490DRAFT_66254 [Saccharata proteae CBS 121410]|uniref:Uncharacterized protein n=1 Tax=Saccharata proteae CBS 121410 TaxID=1314787 RepID=A0A9P4LYB1_9PEZI|nr:hypothetical protein K490DRAFT_66254 [Saccharata proteae CBS 121410]
MSVSLGKRKRAEKSTKVARRKVPAKSPEPSDNEDLQAAFRRAFEAKFKPLDDSVNLPTPKPAETIPEPSEDEEKDSDWDGIAEEDDEPKVEVIEHADISRKQRASRDELKAFMSSKPPSSKPTTVPTTKKKAATDAGSDDDAEATNLKNDLALQRLLTESHLLDPTSSLNPAGSNRHKAMDLRLQSLGAKTSILKQEKMPMSHRKGIVAKASQKEDKRRREAKENGIILEALRKEHVEPKKRERGVGGPGVGRFKNGALNLSQRDVASITGGSRGGKGGKRGRR